jgi:hypothetical protein
MFARSAADHENVIGRRTSAFALLIDSARAIHGRVKHSYRHSVLGLSAFLAVVPACSGSTEPSEERLGSRVDALAACTAQLLNVALASASSEQNNGYFSAANAIDFRTDTRWSSTPGLSAPQWLRLDFGQRRLLASLDIYWETAYAPRYEIQVSDDAVNWAVVRSVTNDKSGLQTVGGLDVTARYVRILARTLSGYGNVSIITVNAYGDSNAACIGTASTCGQSTRLAALQAQATSTEFSYTPAGAAVDGVYSTRWSSAFSDDQAIALDLGAVARIDAVRTSWQAAYAAKYAIETAASLSGPWTVVARNDAGHGGVELVTVPPGTSARYVRLHGVQRATGYGYSLWELDVFGSKDSSCAPNLLTRGWDPAATSNNIGAPTGVASVANLYTIDPVVLNRIDLPQSGQYCPVGGPGYLSFTQHVTMPSAASKLHLALDIPRTTGSLQIAFASSFLGATAGNNWKPMASTDSQGNPAGSLSGPGKLEADFVGSFSAGQTVDLTIKLGILGVNIPNTNCGAMLQNYTIESATLTRVE